MRGNRRERMSVSSAYIGAGNLTSVFARRPRIPFVKIKQIYGDELERFKLEKDKKHLVISELSQKEKKEIKTLVKGIMKRNRKQEITTRIITVILMLGLIYLFVLII